MACSSVRVRPQFPDTVLDTALTQGILMKWKKWGILRGHRATLPFTYTPHLAGFQHGESCVHLDNRSWLPGLTLSEKVDLLYHAGFWGSALPEW